MSYSIYISYSMSDSSKAYDLSGKLSREKISYYLDCVESGFTLSDYTKQVIEECEAFVALVGMSYTEAKYSHDTLRHAIEHGKRIVVCPIEETLLPEPLSAYTIVEEENLLALLMNKDKDDNEESTVAPVATTKDLTPQSIHNEDEVETTTHTFSTENPWLLYNDEPKTIVEPDKSDETKQQTVDSGTSDTPNYEDTGYNADSDSIKDDNEELRDHRDMTPPLYENHENPTNKKGCTGCGCIMYAVILYFICSIFNISLVDLGIEYIKTLLEKEKSPLELHYEKIPKEDLEKGKLLNQQGLEYMNGTNGRPQTPVRALISFEKAAELGNVNAMYNAGLCYLMANREKRNINELEKGAWHLYKATEIGHEKSLEKLKEIANMDIAYAQNSVGVCYAHGYSVERNQMKAVEWYIKAARNGNYAAKYNLAWYYRYGQGGLPKNKHMAYKLYEELAAINYEDAQKLMKEVSKEL